MEMQLIDRISAFSWSAVTRISISFISLQCHRHVNYFFEMNLLMILFPGCFTKSPIPSQFAVSLFLQMHQFIIEQFSTDLFLRSSLGCHFVRLFVPKRINWHRNCRRKEKKLWKNMRSMKKTGWIKRVGAAWLLWTLARCDSIKYALKEQFHWMHFDVPIIDI